MFGKKQQQQYYDSSDEEVHDEVHVDAQMTPAQAKDEEEHLMTLYKPMGETDLKRPQRLRLNMMVIGSPHEFDANSALTMWRIEPSHMDHFKDNLAIHDRHLAKADDLHGSVNRIIPLGLRVFNHQNTFPFAVGVRIPGIRSREVGKDVYAYIMGPNQSSAPQALEIFDPNHIVNKYQYENSIICSVADLDRDLVHTDKGRTKIAVGSFPHAHLVELIQQRAFSREEMAAMNAGHILNPGEDQEVEVPRAVGEKIDKDLRPHIEDASKGLLDASNWVATFHRADGEKQWNSHRKLIGTQVVSKTMDAPKVHSELLHKIALASVQCEIVFQTL